MKIAVLGFVLCVVSMKAQNTQQKCACVYPFEPDPPCVQQCSSMIILSANSEELLRNVLGFSPQDSSKLWKHRGALRKGACETGKDASKVSAELESSITRLIGEDHYDAFVQRFRTLDSNKNAANAQSAQSRPNVFVWKKDAEWEKLTVPRADQLCLFHD
jgi:hypothetical protein